MSIRYEISARRVGKSCRHLVGIELARRSAPDVMPRLCNEKGALSTSVPEWSRQFRLVRVYHEHRKELGRLRLTGISANGVTVLGQLGEALSSIVGRHRSVVDLTADRSLKNGRVNEGGFGVRVARRVTARAIFDEHTLDALAGDVRQLVLVDEGHLGGLLLRRIREDTAERQCGDKQRTKDSFHGALPFFWRIQIRLLPVSGGAIRRDRCGRGALRPTARANAPRRGCRNIGPRGRS